jgi:hypothetical protein
LVERRVMREAAASSDNGPFVRGVGAVGCSELGEMGLLNVDLCCERCHAADRFAIDGMAALGPCREALADGRIALVCCEVRKALAGKGA